MELSDQFKTGIESGLTPGTTDWCGEMYAKTPTGKYVCFLPEAHCGSAIVSVSDQLQIDDVDKCDLVLDFAEGGEADAIDLANTLARIANPYQVRELKRPIRPYLPRRA